MMYDYKDAKKKKVPRTDGLHNIWSNKKKKRRVQVTPGITWQELHYL